jgi:hypothetical protein
MRNYGSIQPLDVYADGGAQTVAVTPGATVQPVEFTVQAPKGGVDGNWPLAMNIVKKIAIQIDQPSSGASTIEADELPIVVDSYNVNSPLLGITHPRDTFTGPIAKHIAEFFSAGYTSADGARIQIPTTDAEYSVVHYQLLPFAQENFVKPHHFAPWLGWLNATKITTYIAPSTAIAAFSTGAVSEAPCSVSCWIEYVVSSELIMPTFAQFHLYESPASGGTTVTVQGIGTSNGMADVKEGSRIAALLELTDINGMGGPDGADNITAVTIPQLGLDLTQNPDAFFTAFRRAMGGHRGAIALSTTVPVADRAGDPYSVIHAAGLETTLNAASAMYIPYRFVGRDQQITKLPRFFGDLRVTRTFTTAPTSGKYRFVTEELREFGELKKKEMIAKTGRPGKLQRIYEGGVPDAEDLARHPHKVAALPERVIF